MLCYKVILSVDDSQNVCSNQSETNLFKKDIGLFITFVYLIKTSDIFEIHFLDQRDMSSNIVQLLSSNRFM